ncbi:hypothetical protein JOD44_002513 [Salimicrobium jeotgali]|uniref:ABC transporter permease n=1 Tax=Salimicrobium jeotgali TaxID=1230341 RepID=UPI0030B8F602|nr:hypothetical protein [Salimicrobium jeotgali]
MKVELKRTLIRKTSLLIAAMVILLPALKFYSIYDSYIFYKPMEVFHETISTIIPLLFPAIIVVLYLPMFIQEQRNNFIKYTTPRVPLHTYLTSKGITNVLVTGISTFLLIFLPFLFVFYIEPSLDIVTYNQIEQNSRVAVDATFTQIFNNYGDFAYGIVYSLWVSLNTILYCTIAFLLLLVIKNPFVALSLPFVYYHVFNFIAGVLNIPRFSPLSTIFPFNIEQQPIWTALLPFTFLVIILLGTFLYVKKNRKEWMI